MARIGVISDTHGLLRPEAMAALAGVDHILHAGDIGSADVLVQLATLAPVTAVRGNNDREQWAARIPETEVFTVGSHSIYLLHDIAELDLDPTAAGLAAVVTGHSHKPKVERRAGVLFVNPGSAGPRRFNLPVTVGMLQVSRTTIRAEIHELLPGARS
jgi:uncharacterized protein